MTLELQARPSGKVGGVDSCPECDALTINVQGVTACPDCNWNAI